MKNPNFNYTAPPETRTLPSEISYFKGKSGHDSQEYKSLGLNMLRHRRFSWNSEPVTFRTPGYPFFIASIYSLLSKSSVAKASFGTPEKAKALSYEHGGDWIVMLFQVFLSTASIYLIYIIGRGGVKIRPYNEWVGIIAASLFSIDFTSILFSSLFMSETLFVFFILLGTLLFLPPTSTHLGMDRAPYSGFIYGLSVLIRPIAFYIFIPLILLLRNLKKALLFLFLFLLPILPWATRNFKIYHSPLLTSSQGFNLLFLHAALVESEEHGISIESAQHKFSKKLFVESYGIGSSNPLKLASRAQKIGIQQIIKNPLRYAFIHLKGGVWALLSTKSDDIIMRLSGYDITQSELLIHALKSERSKIAILAVAGIEVLLIIGSIILGIISFIRSPRLPNLLFFLLTLYFFIFSGPLGESRYRLPLIPFVYLLAAQWVKRR